MDVGHYARRFLHGSRIAVIEPHPLAKLDDHNSVGNAPLRVVHEEDARHPHARLERFERRRLVGNLVLVARLSAQVDAEHTLQIAPVGKQQEVDVVLPRPQRHRFQTGAFTQPQRRTQLCVSLNEEVGKLHVFFREHTLCFLPKTCYHTRCDAPLTRAASWFEITRRSLQNQPGFSFSKTPFTTSFGENSAPSDLNLSASA